MLERSFKSENQVILSVIYIFVTWRSVFYEILKIVTSAPVVLSLFSVRVFADDVTTTEVSEISTQEQEQKQIDDVANALEQMFRNGVNEKNLLNMFIKIFLKKILLLRKMN